MFAKAQNAKAQNATLDKPKIFLDKLYGYFINKKFVLLEDISLESLEHRALEILKGINNLLF
jgi:hypothetical protein